MGFIPVDQMNTIIFKAGMELTVCGLRQKPLLRPHQDSFNENTQCLWPSSKSSSGNSHCSSIPDRGTLGSGIPGSGTPATPRANRANSWHQQQLHGSSDQERAESSGYGAGGGGIRKEGKRTSLSDTKTTPRKTLVQWVIVTCKSGVVTYQSGGLAKMSTYTFAGEAEADCMPCVCSESTCTIPCTCITSDHKALCNLLSIGI